MKRERYIYRRMLATILGILLIAGVTTEVLADIVKTGEGYVPGYCNPKRKIKWRAAHSKTPPGNQPAGNQVHFWLDIELCDPPTDPNDPIYQNGVTFLVCCMLNIKGPKINMPAYIADVNNGTGKWECEPDPDFPPPNGINWYRNYHFGCRRVILKPDPTNSHKHWKHNVFDDRATFSVNFNESDIAAPYFDFAVDCPNGFDQCDALFGAADQFLTPGDNQFPFSDPNGCNGTSSWWIYQGGNVPYDPAPLIRGGGFFPTGNWYTMAYMDVDYPSILEGTLSNVPIGATVNISFPPSAEADDQVLTVTENPFPISIPFTISQHLMDDADEHTYFEVIYNGDIGLPDPNAVIEFVGQVTADATSTFPDGRILWEEGDLMHGIHLQFIPDYDAPFVVSEEVVQLSPTEYEVRVEAGDATTMAIGATFAYSVNDVEAPDYGIPYDDPATDGVNTLFRGKVTVPPGATITDCKIYTVDDAGNVNEYIGANIILSADDPAPSAAGYALHESRPNPFGSITSIPFTLPRRSHVTLEVLDLTGKVVATLLDEDRSEGEHAIDFNAEAHGLPSGTYYARLRAGAFVMTKRMVLLGTMRR